MGLLDVFSRRRQEPVIAAVSEVHKLKESTPQKYSSNAKQQRAWLHYDNVPEMWSSHNLIANALKRVRIFPATQPNPAEPPIPLAPTDGALGARANAELDRLRDADGTHGTLLHDMTLQLCIPGEGLFAMYPDPDDGSEVTRIFSLDQLVMRDEEWVIVDKEGSYDGQRIGKDVENGGDVNVRRFWRPHPRFSSQADSAFFALRKPLDELLILDQLYRSAAKSRVPAGILLVPSEGSLKEKKTPAGPRGRGAPDQAQLDPTVAAVLAAITQPLADEDSAGNVAPPVIKFPGDFIEKWRHLAFGREFDSDTAARYDRVLQRVADGVDLPSGVVMGSMGLDANHWSLWQIDEDAFDDHLAPLVELDCSSVTQMFLQPALLDVQGPGTEKVITWYDASALMSHPNKSKDALKANEQIIISDAATRKHLGYSEEDAPDEAEIARKEERQKKAQAPAPGEPGPPPAQALLASAAMPVAELGLELARLDHDARIQLQAALEGVVLRTVDSAGNRVRAAVLDDRLNAQPFHLQLEGVDNRSVCAVLGRDVVQRFATDEELLDGAIAAALPIYTQIVSRVQRLVRSNAQDYDPDVDLDQLEQQQEADRQRGAEVLAVVLAAAILGTLYSPAIDVPASGELDDFTIPAGDLRDVMAAAGGSPSSTAINPVNNTPEGGVATGDTAMEILIRVGITPDGWQWVYGDTSTRKRSFPGHYALNGVTFLDWQDEKLRITNPNDAWLHSDYYHPGDHKHCQCDFAPVMTEDDTTDPNQLELVET